MERDKEDTLRTAPVIEIPEERKNDSEFLRLLQARQAQCLKWSNSVRRGTKPLDIINTDVPAYIFQILYHLCGEERTVNPWNLSQVLSNEQGARFQLGNFATACQEVNKYLTEPDYLQTCIQEFENRWPPINS